MKNYTIILFFLLLNSLSSIAQSHFDSRLYNQNQRTESGQIRSICPCEAAQFFNSRQNMYTNRPVIFSQNCPQYTLAYSNNTAYKGLTLAEFFRQFKRKRKVKYSKGSHIIPLN
jgi:hypothetical protein